MTKELLSLRCPVLPTLSIAYTLREYTHSSNHDTIIHVAVANISVLFVPDNSYQYHATPAPVSFDAVRSNNIVPVLMYVPVAGVIKLTWLGAILSIHHTFAMVLQVLPTRSINVNSNIPLFVKRFPVSFNPVIDSEDPVIITCTFPLVQVPDVGVYSIYAVGFVVSTSKFHVLLRCPVLPNLSTAYILRV